MLPGGNDPQYRDAIALPHTPTVRIEVYSGAGLLLDGNLAYSSASVQATLQSRVTRKLQMTVPKTLFPWEDGDMLAPFGNYVRAYRGIRLQRPELGGGDYEWEVFRGRIEDVDLGSDDTVRVTCQDRAADVVDGQFETPRQSNEGNMVPEEYRALVKEVVPDAAFTFPSDLRLFKVPELIWEKDRARALDDLATASGAFWYTLADGTFTMAPIPWTVERFPVATIHDGPGGTMAAHTIRVSRAGVYSSVVVAGERADGLPPAVYIARQLDSSAPNYWRGPFGLKVRHMQIQSARTQEQARSAALAQLRRSGALARPWSVEMVPDASLELGDCLNLSYEGHATQQVIASLTMPLTVDGGAMQVQLREQILGGEA